MSEGERAHTTNNKHVHTGTLHDKRAPHGSQGTRDGIQTTQMALQHNLLKGTTITAPPQPCRSQASPPLTRVARVWVPASTHTGGRRTPAPPAHLTLRVRDAVPVRLRVRVAERLRVRVAERVRVGVAERVRVRVADPVRVRVADPVRVRVADRMGVPLALRDAVRVRDAALVGVRVEDGPGLVVGCEKLARPQLLPATLLQLGVKHSMTS